MKLWQSSYNPQCKLSQVDLRDISEEITQTYAPHDTYYEPELVLMPVDPLNLYAYWNLNEIGSDNKINHINKPLALRIYSIPELSEHPSKLQLSFEINVYSFQNQQKVHLPAAATTYSAVIGEINADNSFSTLAVSDTIQVPRENPVPDNNINGNNITVKIDSILESNFIIKHVRQENSKLEPSLDSSEISIKTGQALTNNFVPAVNEQKTRSKSIIIKNFNDYGYDLNVYGNESGTEIKNILSKQGISIHLSTKSSHIDKSTSGQGRLL